MTRSYRNRVEAGEVLAAEVVPFVHGPAVIAGIPRGGAIVAERVATRLHAPLTLAFVRKLALPQAPELAVGVIDEDGQANLDSRIAALLHGTPGDLVEARARVQAEIDRQVALYEPPRLSFLAFGSTVVLVDDGLATGLTMSGAVAFARRHGAREVIVAAPCASPDAADRFEREADRFVCPLVDEAFMAVGAYYEEFGPVTDQEVIDALDRAPRVLPAD